MIIALVLLGIAAGAYAVILFFSPTLAHAFFVKPIPVSSLAKPSPSTNQLVIPKLGINLNYGTSASMLTQQAQWRAAELGNPKDGGIMRLAAHRLSIQSTPQQTVAHSPFYALDTLQNGDKVVVDYEGVRYGYEVTEVKLGALSDTPLPEKSEDASLLVLYTYDSEDDASRTVVSAKSLGKVAVE